MVSMQRNKNILHLWSAYLGRVGTILSPDGRVFKELTYPIEGRVWRYRDFYGSAFLQAVALKAGWYTSLTCPTSYNYFHWIMECLPRLAVLERYQHLLDGIIVPKGHDRSTMKAYERLELIAIV